MPPLSTRRAERLVMTMPPEKGLARLTRRVSYHFFREHGLKIVEARRRARVVENRYQSLLGRRAGRRSGSTASMVLTLSSGDGTLEVVGRLGARGESTSLIRLKRPLAF